MKDNFINKKVISMEVTERPFVAQREFRCADGHNCPPSSVFRTESPMHTVSFAPEVDAKEELRAIRDNKKKITRLFLQSDVAFVVDRFYALKLLEQAKEIIDQRFSDDASLISS